jgi:hypothetical protein
MEEREIWNDLIREREERRVGRERPHPLLLL